MDNNVIVICTNCGAMAPWDPPDLNHPFGVYHWHAPCPRCGAEAWSSHDTNRDWRTGRPLELNTNTNSYTMIYFTWHTSV